MSPASKNHPKGTFVEGFRENFLNPDLCEIKYIINTEPFDMEEGIVRTTLRYFTQILVAAAVLNCCGSQYWGKIPRGRSYDSLLHVLMFKNDMYQVQMKHFACVSWVLLIDFHVEAPFSSTSYF